MSQSHELRVLLGDDDGAGAIASGTGILLSAINCDLKGTERFAVNNGKRATRQRWDCGARLVGEDVVGGFDIKPTAAQLDWFIERMIGDNISGYPAGAAVPKETMSKLVAYVDKGADNYKYPSLVISDVTITMPEGDHINMRVNFVGQREYDGETWPSGGGIPTTYSCASAFVASDVVFTVDATAFSFKTLTLAINNMIAPGQQENALYRTIFETQGLDVSASGTFGVRSNTIALYRRGVAGDAATIVLDDGTDTYTFSLGNLKIPGEGGTVPDEGEITMNLAGAAYRTTGADQISIAKT